MYSYFETQDAVYCISNDKPTKHLKAWDSMTGFRYYFVEISIGEYRHAYLTERI